MRSPKTPDLADLLTEIRALRDELRLGARGLLTVPQAADYLGIAPKTLRNRLGPRAANPFPVRPVRVGKRVLFRRSDLDGFIDGMGPT